jgi:hypothetical protein
MGGLFRAEKCILSFNSAAKNWEINLCAPCDLQTGNAVCSLPGQLQFGLANNKTCDAQRRPAKVTD